MIKKIIKISSILLLTIFSFYYTNKSIDLIRNQDPIMDQIKNTEKKYNVKAVNAEIKENTMIPGKTGVVIDYEKTYTKMKQYGAYNETLTTLKNVKPEISIDDYYDKFIISGNTEKKSVALIFKVEDKSPKEVTSILNNKNIKATFFIDGLYLENNVKEITSMTNFELEVLSYDSQYNELYFSSSKDYLESLTNRTLKYCYSEYDQEEVINLCKKLNMHTIIPTIKINNYLYQEIKDKLTNSAIISISLTTQNINELSTTIDYIKTRGYKFETLESLLNEKFDK